MLLTLGAKPYYNGLDVRRAGMRLHHSIYLQKGDTTLIRYLVRIATNARYTAHPEVEGLESVSGAVVLPLR